MGCCQLVCSHTGPHCVSATAQGKGNVNNNHLIHRLGDKIPICRHHRFKSVAIGYNAN